MNASTFLLKSTQNKNFGTAFCIKQDEKGSYFVTCTHVVEDCGEESLELEQQKANLIAIGSKESVDLAVLFVKDFFNCSVLKLSAESVDDGRAFSVDGFQRVVHKKDSYKLEELKGFVRKTVQMQSSSETINAYELNLNDGDSIERGYSGSAIVCDGLVVAVATDRKIDGKEAYAIPIRYLKEIWEEVSNELFVTSTFQKFNMLNSIQKYLLQTVIGVIILGLLTNFIYDKLKDSKTISLEKKVIVNENNNTNSTIELHNDNNNSTDKKTIEFNKNQTQNSTIKVFQ